MGMREQRNFRGRLVRLKVTFLISSAKEKEKRKNRDSPAWGLVAAGHENPSAVCSAKPNTTPISNIVSLLVLFMIGDEALEFGGRWNEKRWLERITTTIAGLGKVERTKRRGDQQTNAVKRCRGGEKVGPQRLSRNARVRQLLAVKLRPRD